VAQHALQLAIGHARSRRQFGREICEFQAIQHYIAEAAAKIEASRWLIYRAAINAAREPLGLPAGDDAAYAKFVANQMVFEVTDRALQIFGGAGYVDNSKIGKLFLFARGESIAGGTIEMQKNMIAARVMGRKFSQRGAAATV
jgi:alkylation response protein AidB-like acyl-CoA dehydrogenase